MAFVFTLYRNKKNAHAHWTSVVKNFPYFDQIPKFLQGKDEPNTEHIQIFFTSLFQIFFLFACLALWVLSFYL